MVEIAGMGFLEAINCWYENVVKRFVRACLRSIMNMHTL
jgi:hypothetical protein